MRRESVKGVVYFVVFFLLGLGGYTLLEGIIAPSKPMVSEESTNRTRGVSQVAASVSPAVVGITSLKRDGNVFDQRSTETTGSGVIIDQAGYIVTNNHVVRDADRLTVTLADGTETGASIVGTDARTDLALIQVKGKHNLTIARFGNSDNLTVGEQVIAIGNPLGLRFARSVTAGVVSGLNRMLTTEEGFVFRLVQTDAAINPGNSGGALVNLNGEVIGINTVKIAVEGYEGLGFAIPSNQVKMVVDDIKRYGKVRRALMGVRIIGEVSADQARYYDLPLTHGVVVEPNSEGPAKKAGIKQYDIITHVNGKTISTVQELQEATLNKKIGQTIKIKLLRINEKQNRIETKTLKIKLTE
ncbi:S1C family serine protease [Syntrophomonas erecta]